MRLKKIAFVLFALIALVFAVSMTVYADEITVTDINNNEVNFSIDVNSSIVPENAKAVKVAVWSKSKGQDDLVWYNTSKSSGKYYCTVQIKNHKTMGDYNVHVYAQDKNGKMILIGNTLFSVDNKPEASIMIERVDRRTGKLLVRLYNLNVPAGISKVMIPTWSKGDQSDIKWYNATAESDGSYTVLVDIANHKNNYGKYNFHAYVTMNNGIQSMAASTTYNLTKQNQDKIVNLDSSSNGIVCEELKNKVGYYRVSVSNVYVNADLDRIEYAVWSSTGGQDDIIWFNAKNESGKYYADLSMASFKDIGAYKVNAYAVLKNGNKVLLDESGFTIGKPSVGKVTISNVNAEAGTFKATLSDIKNISGMEKLLISVRCTSNESDMYFYTAKKASGSDNYYANINISNNDYALGTYIVDAYVYDITGDDYTTAYAKQDMKITFTSIESTNPDGVEKSIGVFLKDLSVPAGASKVQFAVWSKTGGQDDIIWYTATKRDDYYYVYIPINEHRTLGEYNVHVYATLKNNTKKLTTSTVFEIKNKSTGKVKVSNVDRTKGTFKVTVYDIKAPAGVGEVMVPVWCSSNQSDIKWYLATKQSDGNYSVTVKVSNHKHHFGNYKVHAYVTMENGIRNFVAGTNSAISPLNYLKVEKINDGSAKLVLMNAGNGYVNEVLFPTWSKTKGQDDIKWYKASYAGDGNWSAVVKTENHKSLGDYITHAYVKYNGKQTSVNSAQYTLKGKDFSQLLGRFSTVSVNNANGTFNMTRALLSFNGVVMYPGDTISFFAQAGPCGFAQGYKVAGTVQGTGYGGGICQASTTLYGAALRGGMTIVERRSHSARSVYVPIGQDAMVSYGSSDLKFRNDLNRPVKIVTYVKGKTLYAEIWGIQPEWYDDVKINSWSTGANSAAAERLFYKNGRLVKQERLTNSYYPKG